MERSFTVKTSDVGVTGGRYVGKAPYNAAAKVARALFKSSKKGGKSTIRFTITETTRGSVGKEFTYIGMKQTLDEPLIVKRGDSEIKITHKYHVRSCKA